MQTLITRPTIADAVNKAQMVAVLALEIRDLEAKQEALFRKAVRLAADEANFWAVRELEAQVDSLHNQQIDLVKYMHAVHYQALVEEEDVFIPTFARAA